MILCIASTVQPFLSSHLLRLLEFFTRAYRFQMLELSSMHVNGGNTSNQSNTTRVPENHKNAERNTKMNTAKRELKNPFPPPTLEMTAWL